MIKWVFICGVSCLFLFFSWLPLPSFQNDFSVQVVDKKQRLLRAYLTDGEQWHFNRRDQYPENLKIAVIAYEDAYFNWHFGVNPVSLVKALYENIHRQYVFRGGSTITMQLMRILKPKSRTYSHKLLELLQAIKYEWVYSKPFILHQYLTHAAYGGNIIGAQTASLKYFEKDVAELSWAQAALLAVLPNAPSFLSPVKNHAALLKKRNELLYKLWKMKKFDDHSYYLSLKEPMPNSLYYFDTFAEHLADQCRLKLTGEDYIETTLDRDIQQLAEDILRNHIDSMQHYGLHHASLVVADVNSGEVLAYVGSPDYFDLAQHGSIDLVQSSRSTGSVLKPFLFAAAIDSGLILPDTIMFDIPSNFDGYQPANFSQEFLGTVFAKKALVDSLNVPAVRLLNTYGVDEFYTFLKRAGLSSLFRSSEDYGLPLILGGAEATLLELTGLYQGLANGGVFQSLQYLKSSGQWLSKPGVRLLSRGSSFLTLEMLKHVKRPGSQYYWELFDNYHPLSWKTGTSYAQKDGWAIGVNPQWVVGVWVGDVHGQENSNLTGAQFAGPLLFDMFNELPKDPQHIWFSAPSEALYPLQTCSETGFVANKYCSLKREQLKPVHSAYLKRCLFHKPIFLSNLHGYEVCSDCWDVTDVKKSVILDYPTEVVDYINKRWLIKPFRPMHNPACMHVDLDSVMSIDYPTDGTVIWLPRDFDGEFEQVTLSVHHKQPSQMVYWYLNDIYYGKTQHYHTLSVKLDAGRYRLVAVDELANKTSVTFEIVLSTENIAD